MAGPGTAAQIYGAADIFGGHAFTTIDYTGVASYVSGSTGGELLDPKQFGFANAILTVIGESIDTTGVYSVQAQPTAKGVTTWHLRWFTAATGAEVSNATDLHLITVKLSAIGY